MEVGGETWWLGYTEMGRNIDLFTASFLGGSVVKKKKKKKSTCSAGDAGDSSLIPGLGRSPGGRHGNPLLYSCLENSMDRAAWRAAVHGIAKVGHN